MKVNTSLPFHLTHQQLDEIKLFCLSLDNHFFYTIHRLHVFFSSRRRHTRYWRDWSSDVCSSDLWIGSAFRFSLESYDDELGEVAGTVGVAVNLTQIAPLR